MDEVVDRCAEAPEPPEAPAQQLPEGDFIDGLLGLLEEDALASRLAELEDEQLYEDADFPADASSLSYSDPNDEALADIVWMRPHELVDEPALFVDGVSRGDVKQGDLGDCWFLSACASVARRPDLIERVVSPGQPLYGPGYQGVVAVRLWRFGAWVSVHVDDRLPTRDGRLLYASCADPREFWVAFIEKAYAKLHGSYEALAGGHSLEAFVDLTGGLAEKLSLKELPFRQLRIAFEHGAFVTCARRGDWQLATQRDEATGLVQGHAYTVTDVRRLEPREPDGAVRLLRLVRVRNPWAGSEWTGAWSDGDPRWDALDEETKQALSVTATEDGEFWMEYEDFQAQFEEVTVATLGPDFDADGSSDASDQVKIIQDRWTEGENAGGCRNDLEKFATNPQYLINLTETDDPDSESGDTAKCSLLVGLMQEHRRSEKNREMRMRAIAFFVYKTDTPSERLSAEYFLCVPEEGSSGVFVNSREVLGRFELEPGYYVLIPATYYPDQTRTFMLRIFGLKPFDVRKLPDQEILIHEQDAFVEEIT
ncbi:hypothetical protein R5R35_008075 [Gryllus longicercus]|uniref:Calpain catalytic domain-containing protein n=1 Tax=Gryllus longicercus TaxID=2509291 RepID=A0AAN9VAZ9_9ORTH